MHLTFLLSHYKFPCHYKFQQKDTNTNVFFIRKFPGRPKNICIFLYGSKLFKRVSNSLSFSILFKKNKKYFTKKSVESKTMITYIQNNQFIYFDF